jgi:hypothetical protein
MKRILLVLGGALAVLMLFSVACGGDDNKSTPTTAGTKTSAPTTKTVSATATPAASVEGTPISSAQLSSYLAEIKAVLADTIAKAQAGDVQGTRDAEGKGDTAMEGIIRSVRVVDPALADQIETLELDYEHQADATNTDLSVIIKDAQAALPLLDQAGVKLNIH